jgi:Tfp pilus assembly protein PilV
MKNEKLNKNYKLKIGEFSHTTELGQSLFEVILALAIVTLVIVTIVALAATSIRNTSFSKNKTLAAKYSQEALEWLRGERDKSWESFADFALTPVWCLKNLAWEQSTGCSSADVVAGTTLRREVIFQNIAADNIETKIKIYWQDNQGLHEVNSVTNFTNWSAK